MFTNTKPFDYCTNCTEVKRTPFFSSQISLQLSPINSAVLLCPLARRFSVWPLVPCPPTNFTRQTQLRGRNTQKKERNRDLLNIEVVAALNLAHCRLHHLRNCLPSEELVRECGRARPLSYLSPAALHHARSGSKFWRRYGTGVAVQGA